MYKLLFDPTVGRIVYPFLVALFFAFNKFQAPRGSDPVTAEPDAWAMSAPQITVVLVLLAVGGLGLFSRLGKARREMQESMKEKGDGAAWKAGTQREWETRAVAMLDGHPLSSSRPQRKIPTVRKFGKR